MTVKGFLPLLLIAAAASLVPVLPAAAEPPAWAPAHGQRAKHDYMYYPLAEVYHDPARDVWFWLDGDDWRSGNALPILYRQYTHHGVNVQLDTERPFEKHEHVVSQHGRGTQAIREQGRDARDSKRGERGGKTHPHESQGKHKAKAEKRHQDSAQTQPHSDRGDEQNSGHRGDPAGHPAMRDGMGHGEGKGHGRRRGEGQEGEGHERGQGAGHGSGPAQQPGSGRGAP